jgi:spore coat protein U-like protein
MRRVDSRSHAAVLGLALGALLAPAPAEAACTVSSSGVAFGAYNSLSGTPDDSTGTILVDCHPSDQSIEIALGAGLSGSFATRGMSSGAATLNYNLYTDASRTIIWGDGTGGSVTHTLNSGVVTSGTRRFTATVYGRIPATQRVPAGTYNDTLIVTVTF